MTHVVIVGGGNAAFAAAVSARDSGADVTLLERAPEALRGGNSRFTAGAMRVVYDGIADLRKLMPDLTDTEVARTDFGEYSSASFYEDLGRVTNWRCDPELAAHLVEESLPTLLWMRGHGLRFLPLYGRQSFEVEGRVRFWGGLTVEAWGGGPGLIDGWTAIAKHAGVRVHYDTRAIGIATAGGSISGVHVRAQGREEIITADRVVLASGGFEANPAWRARYLGPGWDLARVRGTRFNTGDGIDMALAIGAAARGHWSGCHAVGWDLNAPEFGDLEVGDAFQKHSYPLGIMINARGQRFVDEGADFRNYTYARYGGEILAQPNQFAWQVFDAKVIPLLRDEYRIRRITHVEADDLQTLVKRMENVDAREFLDTVTQFNAAVDTSVRFDPSVKDARAARGLQVPKSNWANTIDTPPFHAYGVTCGITFTFGGLAVDAQARVLDEAGAPIAGLFAAGELVGGLFYHNYPGGTGLTSGAVFGRTAGRNAAAMRA
ncbi:MAG: FAD-dependent tricarballylate dehydrogenase TcuA [Gammaproteobacteria bacterium]|nr:FAD-dependent tricarballylate dehydrogenase TcuA [Gammaproteobacteria bacterium]